MVEYDFDRLLDPSPVSLEMGYERLPSGVLHIAVRTDMHRCTGAMVDWWFGSRPTTREYRWWHPIDHLSSSFEHGTRGQAVGSVHSVDEYLTSIPPMKLFIQFREPSEAFDRDLLAKARSSGDVSGLVFAHGATQEGATYTPDGKLIGTRLVHLARDTEWGTVLRSRFLFGYDLPGLGMPPGEIEKLIPEIIGPNLLQHCYDEMTFLSRILPPLYTAEALSREEVIRPW